MFKSTHVFTLIFLLSMQFINAKAQSGWPKEVTSNGTIINVYEPQPETYSQDKITARAAVSLRKKKTDEPVYGVMSFEAILEPQSNNTTIVKTINVSASKFADGDEQSKTLLKEVLEKEVPSMNIQLNSNRMDEVLAQLKQDEDTGINNAPPKIFYRDKPTTLIVLNGEPIEQQDNDLKMVRVVNSPYLIVKNPDDKKYYLYGGSFWYSSGEIKTGWSHAKNLPSKIKALDNSIKEQEKKDDKKGEQEAPKFTDPTDILVSTEPAELIQTEGKPTYKTVENSTLLYVDNSLDDIFKDVESQKNYILLSGRWYQSASVEGPWEYVASDALPAAFATIPKGSERDGVLASVAGTEEAQDAVMSAYIPQTAKVDRSSVTCTVTYDGNPKFEPIPNTNLLLAENANLTVMLAPNKQYYALDNGIWFKSANANGPWEVANERPSDVEKIPADNRAYNTKYVYVYETTPRYVYVGYTPGYLGCYHYRHTVIWGTGWHYRPWYGYHYYPRPYTWGFGMHYNPWSGWSISFGLSFNYGWYHSPYNRGGWFGPPMYRPPYHPWGWNGGYYGRPPHGQRPPNGHRPPERHPRVTSNRPSGWNKTSVVNPRIAMEDNIYRNRKAIVSRDKIQRPSVRPSLPATKPTIPSRPNVPKTRPTIPTRPSVPATRPTIPTKPSVPATRPTIPTKPSVPTTRPTIPSKPSVPSVKQPKLPVKKPTVTPKAPTRVKANNGNGN